MGIPWITLSPLWALVAFIVYRVLASVVTSQRNAMRARDLKCQDPPTLKSTLPFGLDLLKRAMAADKEKLFPDEIIRRYSEAGATTYLYSTMGATNLSTAG